MSCSGPRLRSNARCAFAVILPSDVDAAFFKLRQAEIHLVMPTIPARFGRGGASQVAGCLVYLVAAPFVALVLALFVAIPLGYALEAVGVPTNRGGLPFLILLPVIGLGVAVWGYRDYRHRAALAVVIDRKCITVGVGRSQRVLNYADTGSIRVTPTTLDFACVLIPRSGKRLRLPPEIAPFSVVHEPLEQTLIPQLVQRLDERIAAGEAVELRISAGRLFVLTCQALLTLALGVLMVFSLLKIRLGSLILQNAAIVVQQLGLAYRGGFVVERRGLRRLAGWTGESTPWVSLEPVRNDWVGLVLRSRVDGRTFRLSSLTDDFWPASRWLNAR